MNNILTDANQKLTTTVDGTTVTSTSRVLQEGRSEKIQGQLQKQAVTIAKKFILGKFGTTGMYEKDKLEGRNRKLLLHKHEINRIEAKLAEKGLTAVPTKLYFKGGIIKVEFGLAKGKKLYDKRESMKKKDHDRELKLIKLI